MRHLGTQDFDSESYEYSRSTTSGLNVGYPKVLHDLQLTEQLVVSTVKVYIVAAAVQVRYRH